MTIENATLKTTSFAYARTILYFFYLYLPLKAIRFFCCRIIKKVRGRRKLTFQTIAFRKVIRAKILFDRECKMNPLLSKSSYFFHESFFYFFTFRDVPCSWFYRRPFPLFVHSASPTTKVDREIRHLVLRVEDYRSSSRF